MDILSLYKDYRIPIAEETDRHFHDGWINTPCPFCSGSPGFHLGYNTNDDYYHCWRCGGKRTVNVLMELLKVNRNEVYQIIRKYKGITIRSIKKPKVNLHPLKFPSLTGSLQKQHINYLAKRNFTTNDAEFWDAVGTGPMSFLDGINYSNRILIPIYWEKEMVSFQARIIKDALPSKVPKYMACPKKREKIEHQKILYRHKNAHSEKAVIVEGIMDAWRVGEYAAATFGISYTPYQVKEISRLFKKVVIWYDPEPQAQKQAHKLQAELEFRGLKVFNIVTEGDPAETQSKENLWKKYLEV